jgi:hypothetical protein
LCLGQHCWFAFGEILKEGPNRRKTMISTAYLIVSLLFKEIQKAPYPFTRQIRQTEACELTAGIIGHEQQKEPQCVPIAPNTG